MSEYIKQNFMSGQILEAEHLNHMEDGIGQLSEEIVNLKENGGTGTDEVVRELLDLHPKPSKNLNVTPYDKTFTAKGCTIVINDDNSATISGTPTGNIFWPVIATEIEKRWQLPAGTYTLSGSPSPYIGITLFLYASQTDAAPASEYVQGGNDGAPIKVVVPSDCWAIIRFNVDKRWPDGNVTIYPQLEAGELATGYVSPWGEELFSKRLAGIETELDKLDVTVNPLAVPDYYFAGNYLPGKVARINELMKTCSNNGDVFAFITDTHWEKNAGKSPALLNYVRKNTHIDRLFGGGDYIDGANSDTEMYDVSTIFRDAWAGPRYFTLGNHDYMGDAAYRETDASLYYIWNSYGTERVGNLSRNYYYVDNQQMKMRYIVLNRYVDRGEENAEIHGINEEQRTWLRDVALEVETDWTVLVFVHDLYRFIYNEDGYTSRMSLGYADSEATVTILDDFVEGGGTVAGIICGEAHVDMVNRTPGGIPVITTTCDKNTGTEAALPINEQFAARPSGTIKEQVIDVMVIDKTMRTITAVRIGYPARNSVEGSYGELVEERTITY